MNPCHELRKDQYLGPEHQRCHSADGLECMQAPCVPGVSVGLSALGRPVNLLTKQDVDRESDMLISQLIESRAKHERELDDQRKQYEVKLASVTVELDEAKSRVVQLMHQHYACYQSHKTSKEQFDRERFERSIAEAGRQGKICQTELRGALNLPLTIQGLDDCSEAMGLGKSKKDLLISAYEAEIESLKESAKSDAVKLRNQQKEITRLNQMLARVQSALEQYLSENSNRQQAFGDKRAGEYGLSAFQGKNLPERKSVDDTPLSKPRGMSLKDIAPLSPETRGLGGRDWAAMGPSSKPGQASLTVSRKNEFFGKNDSSGKYDSLGNRSSPIRSGDRHKPTSEPSTSLPTTKLACLTSSSKDRMGRPRGNGASSQVKSFFSESSTEFDKSTQSKHSLPLGGADSANDSFPVGTVSSKVSDEDFANLLAVFKRALERYGTWDNAMTAWQSCGVAQGASDRNSVSQRDIARGIESGLGFPRKFASLILEALGVEDKDLNRENYARRVDSSRLIESGTRVDPTCAFSLGALAKSFDRPIGRSQWRALGDAIHADSKLDQALSYRPNLFKYRVAHVDERNKREEAMKDEFVAFLRKLRVRVYAKYGHWKSAFSELCKPSGVNGLGSALPGTVSVSANVLTTSLLSLMRNHESIDPCSDEVKFMLSRLVHALLKPGTSQANSPHPANSSHPASEGSDSLFCESDWSELENSIRAFVADNDQPHYGSLHCSKFGPKLDSHSSSG